MSGYDFRKGQDRYNGSFLTGSGHRLGRAGAAYLVCPDLEAQQRVRAELASSLRADMIFGKDR